MLKRLQQSSPNVLVLAASAIVFAACLFAIQGWISTRIPDTAAILISARDLQPGERVRASDLVEQTVFMDASTGLYFKASDAGSLVGAYAALPLHAGQPILRDSLIAAASASDRFSALLAQFPDHSLFPLPLDSSNIIAPPIDLFLPGDLLAITVVMDGQPQHPPTETAGGFSVTLPGAAATALPAGVPVQQGGIAETDPQDDPPLAKDFFPDGVRVVSVQGLPRQPGPGEPAQAFDSAPDQPMLILLVADEGRERLSLALQQGDSVIISLINHGSHIQSTRGYTYWDFETWFEAEREGNPLP